MASSSACRCDRQLMMMLQARPKSLASYTKVEHNLSQMVGQTALHRLADCDTREMRGAPGPGGSQPFRASADGSERYERCCNTQAEGQGGDDREPEHDPAGCGRQAGLQADRRNRGGGRARRG